ncbi:MAG: peptide deformylase [Calditrichaceae bacterium]
MYKIRLIGDPVLRKNTNKVTDFNDNVKRIIKNMIAVMHREDGVGLAAPQVGLESSILVIDVSAVEENEIPRAYINPEIHETAGESVIEEGCLSIPGVREEVQRPEKIKLSYNDEDGNFHKELIDGWKARVLQHEIDHLNGVLFVDRISPVKRQLLINQNIIPEKY